MPPSFKEVTDLCVLSLFLNWVSIADPEVHAQTTPTSSSLCADLALDYHPPRIGSSLSLGLFGHDCLALTVLWVV